MLWNNDDNNMSTAAWIAYTCGAYFLTFLPIATIVIGYITR